MFFTFLINYFKGLDKLVRSYCNINIKYNISLLALLLLLLLL